MRPVPAQRGRASRTVLCVALALGCAVTATALGCRELTGPAQAVEVRILTDRPMVSGAVHYEIHNRSAEPVFMEACFSGTGDPPRFRPLLERFYDGRWRPPIVIVCSNRPFRTALAPDTVVADSLRGLFDRPAVYRLAFRIWAADAPSRPAIRVRSPTFTVEAR